MKDIQVDYKRPQQEASNIVSTSVKDIQVDYKHPQQEASNIVSTGAKDIQADFINVLSRRLATLYLQV